MRGTKRERTAGVWELRVYIGRDKITGKPRQKSRTFRGVEKDADTELARMVTATADGKHGGTNATVDTLLEMWIEEVETSLSPATVAVYKDSIRCHLKPALGHVRVNKLEVQHLDTLYRAMERAGKSAYVVRQSHATMRAALGLAVRWGWVSVNVGRNAKPTQLPDEDVTYPSPEEVKQLLFQLERTDPDLALAVMLAALTGCRRSEVMALRWDDWDGDRLHVRRRLIEAAGHVSERQGTKGGKGKRIVLDPIGIATLERLRALQEARAQLTKAKLPKNGYLLSLDGLGGKPRRPKNVSTAVGEAFKAIGRPKFHLHSLRHMAASELLGAGVDVKTVAARLGHADAALTLRVYSHTIESREREAASVLGNLLSATPIKPQVSGSISAPQIAPLAPTPTEMSAQ